MRKGAIESMEAPMPTSEQEALNGVTAKPTPDHNNSTNKTTQHTEGKGNYGRLGGKGHAGNG